MNFAKFLRIPFLQNTSGRLLLLLTFQMLPPEVFYGKGALKISQNSQENFGFRNFKTPFLQNTSRRLLLPLAFQKQLPEVFYEKCVLENFAKFSGKHLWFAKFSKHLFYKTPLDKCFWYFLFNVTKMGVLSTVFGKPQMNIHYLETLTLEVPFRYIVSFFGRINFQCISSLVYTVHCQKQPSE